MVIFHAEKRAEFPSHKNHDIRLSNAKNDVKLEYFKRGNFPGAEAGKRKCDRGQYTKSFKLHQGGKSESPQELT